MPTRHNKTPKEAPACPTGFDQCFRSFPVCVFGVFGLGFTSVRVTESHTLRPEPIPTTNAGSAARLVVADLEDAPVLYPREGRTLLCLHIFAGYICLVTDIYSENMETYMQNYANSNDNNINNNRHLQHQHLITPHHTSNLLPSSGCKWVYICLGDLLRHLTETRIKSDAQRGAFRCAAQVALVQMALGYLPRLSMFEPHINTIKYI
jgi:hypothetical protein